MDRGGIWKSNVEISPNCPRCGSCNTKFCYYNNYSLTQPRYFCKGCRRYWTRGGSLRNVPVGGGCRKIRRPNKLSLIKPTASAAAGAGGGSVNSNNQDGSDSKNISSGFHIDLALVYANFLNLQPQHQDSKIDESAVPELPSVNIGPELLRVDDDQQLSDVSNQLLPYFSELDSIHHPNTHHQQYFGLPPFPGEEVGSHEHEESLWSNLGHAHALQVSSCSATGQLLGLQQEAPEPNLLVSGGDHSWSLFDLSTFDSFSRP